jgi:hypothetical protein
VAREGGGPGEYRGGGVQPELDGGHDPEVGATAPDRPEQIRLTVGVDGPQLTVRGDDLRPHHTVGGEPVPAGQPAHAAASAALHASPNPVAKSSSSSVRPKTLTLNRSPGYGWATSASMAVPRPNFPGLRVTPDEPTPAILQQRQRSAPSRRPN